jgi:hypothetical protein
MNNGLIERYVYAVAYHLPRKIREDVEKELGSLISDMLEARCNGAAPSEADVKAVLSELGTPEQLASKYSGDEKASLISGTYFLAYKKALSIALPIPAICIFFANLITVLIREKRTDALAFILKLIDSSLIGAVAAAFQSFAAITLVFAVLERKKAVLSDGDILSALPPVPMPRARIKRHEPIANICWNIFAAALFLGFPQAIGAWSPEIGWIPALDAQALRSFWAIVVLWAAFGIAKEAVKLIEGSYTKRVAAATAIANLAAAIASSAVFARARVMNPIFAPAFAGLAGEGGSAISALLGNLNLIMLGTVLFSLALDTGVAFWKLWRYAQREDS